MSDIAIITVKVPKATRDKLKEIAQKDRRTVNAYLHLTIDKIIASQPK